MSEDFIFDTGRVGRDVLLEYEIETVFAPDFYGPFIEAFATNLNPSSR